MTKVRNFSENLENHLVRLGHDVAKYRELPENKDRPERELVKQSLRSLAGEEGRPANPAGVSVPASASAPSPANDLLPDYLSGDSDQAVKKSVERLLGMAAEGDLEKAIVEGRKYPPFVEDSFHDALVDKLVPELKKRGIIK